MMYRILDVDEIKILKLKLKEGLPGTAKIFYTIHNLLTGQLPGLEVVVDKWPQWTCIVLRPSGKEVHTFFRHTYICHTNSVRALKYFIQRPGVISWNYPANFSGIPYDLVPALRDSSQKRGGKLLSTEPHFMYAWCKNTPIEDNFTIPDGFQLTSLQKEHTEMIYKHWNLVGHDGVLDYFKQLIENFESSCLKNHQGELVAYALRKFNGAMAMVFVFPDHRGLGYGKLVVTDLARKIIKSGDLAFGLVPKREINIIKAASELCYTWVPQSNMTWAYYEPALPVRTVGSLNGRK